MFRVLQFNIQFGQSWDEKTPDLAPIRLERTIEELRKSEADVILLQEIEKADRARPVPDSPNYARLACALGGEYSGVYALPAPDPRELPFGVGQAIFVRGGLGETRSVRLPSPPIQFSYKGEPKTPTDRVMLGATASFGGRTLRILNVHLLAFFMLRSSSEEHPEQRERVVEELRRTQGPALIGGDFNVSRHASLVDQMREAGFSAAQTEIPTWRRRPYVLDHLFYNAGLRCLRRKVVPTDASDHHLLLADFDFV